MSKIYNKREDNIHSLPTHKVKHFKMKILVLAAILLLKSGDSGRHALYLPLQEPTTTEAETQDQGSQCTGDSQLTEPLFNFGEPQVDQGATLMLLDQLVNGPMSLEQVNQVAIRLEEISRPSTSSAITP